jgi:diacylglycerol kinase (ATP)
MHNPYKGVTGLRRVWRAAGHSMAGLKVAYESESAFRQEFWVAVVLVPAAFGLGRDWVEVSLLAASVLAVLVVELLNSALEHAVDRVSLDLHELSRRAKDLGSAAVLLSLLTCAGIWASALWSRWLH